MAKELRMLLEWKPGQPLSVTHKRKSNCRDRVYGTNGAKAVDILLAEVLIVLLLIRVVNLLVMI